MSDLTAIYARATDLLRERFPEGTTSLKALQKATRDALKEQIDAEASERRCGPDEDNGRHVAQVGQDSAAPRATQGATGNQSRKGARLSEAVSADQTGAEGPSEANEVAGHLLEPRFRRHCGSLVSADEIPCDTPDCALASGTLTEGGDVEQAPGDSLSGPTGNAGDAQ